MNKFVDTLIKYYKARHPVEDNEKFLKLCRAQRIITPFMTMEGCFQCGQCCKEAYLIQIDHMDIAVISTTLKILPKDFVRSEGNNHYIKFSEPCQFLKKIGDKHKCSIHSFRPKICRIFPLFEYEGKKYILNWSFCGIALNNATEYIKNEMR